MSCSLPKKKFWQAAVGRGGTLASAKSVLVEARKDVGLLKGKPLSTKSPDYEVGDEKEDHEEAQYDEEDREEDGEEDGEEDEEEEQRVNLLSPRE